MKTCFWSLAVAASLALPLTASAKDDPKAARDLADSMVAALDANVAVLKELGALLGSEKKPCAAAGKEVVAALERRKKEARKIIERVRLAQSRASEATRAAAAGRAQAQMEARLRAMATQQTQWSGTAGRFEARCPAESKRVAGTLLELQNLFDDGLGSGEEEAE